MSKSISTIEILGIDIDNSRKRIEYRITPEMNWTTLEINHVKSIYMFDIYNNEGLKKASCLKNTEPLLKQGHQYNWIKVKLLDYQLQFSKAHQFLELNEERSDESLH